MGIVRSLLLITLPAVVVAFGAAELGMRAFVKDLPRDHIIESPSYDPVYHHRPAFDPADVPLQRDRPRVVFLGDSFTQGIKLDQPGDTIPAQFEAIASTEHAAAIQSINLGTMSYSPSIEYLVLKNVAVRLDPSAIVLLVDESDVQDDAIYASMAKTEGDELVAIDPVDLQYTSPVFRSQFVRFAYFAWLRLVGDASLEDYSSAIYARFEKQPPTCATHKIFCPDHRLSYRHHDEPPAYYQPHYDRTLSYLDRIRRCAGAAGIPLLIVTYPYPAALDATEHAAGWRKRRGLPAGTVLTSAFEPVVAAWAQRSAVPYVDMADAVAKQGDVSRLYPGDHSHFNAAGNRLIAAELVPVVLKLLAAETPRRAGE